jgi:hypothetical protein
MTAIPDPGDGLGPEARALLDAAREGLSPDPAAVRRVHARIHAATGVAAAAGTALGVKLGLIALIAAGVIAGAAAYSRRGPIAVPPPTPPLASLELADPPEQPQRAAVHDAVPPPRSPRSSDEKPIALEPVQRAPVRRAPPRPASGPKPAIAPAAPGVAPAAAPVATPAAGPVAGPVAGIALGREVELIDQAMAALRRGDPSAALRGMQNYAREAGGGGQLAEDAAAIEVEALCKLGDPAAPDRRAAFDARFPRSAQRARLAAACP